MLTIARLAAMVGATALGLLLPSCSDETPPLDLQVKVPFAPHLVLSPSWQHLAYEVDLTGTYPAVGHTLRRVEVLDAASQAVLRTYEDLSVKDRSLTSNLLLPKDEVTIPMLLVWLKLKPSQTVPSSLIHRFHFVRHSDGADVTLTGAQTTVDVSPVRVIASPVKGELYLAAETSDERIHHFRLPIMANGATKMPQRHAVDLEQLTADYDMCSGDKSLNTSYPSWGADLLAVADGTVEDIRDTLEDHAGASDAKVPTSEATGNHVYLNIGQGQWAIYAHCMKGGVLVKKGDKVTTGQAVCKMGNSGASAAPHLHFQLSNGPDPMAAESVPYVFDRFTLTGNMSVDGKFTPVDGGPREVTARVPDFQDVLTFK